eukprot:m.57058 g.57058  ORF g.57058 m.57058 type:complete len:1849 (+) comp12693_c0_seq1:1027-6573(+)
MSTNGKRASGAGLSKTFQKAARDASSIDPKKLFSFPQPDPSAEQQSTPSINPLRRLLKRDDAETRAAEVPPFAWGNDPGAPGSNAQRASLSVPPGGPPGDASSTNAATMAPTAATAKPAKVAKAGKSAKPNQQAEATTTSSSVQGAASVESKTGARGASSGSSSSTAPSPGPQTSTPHKLAADAKLSPRPNSAQRRDTPNVSESTGSNDASSSEPRGVRSPRSPPTRTLAAVLKTIGMMGKNMPTHQLDLRDHWMPDENARLCYECESPFNTFRRRHHCRVCGQIFCWRCCREIVSGSSFGYRGELRCCLYCARVIRNVSRSDGSLRMQGLPADGAPKAASPSRPAFATVEQKPSSIGLLSHFGAPIEMTLQTCLSLLRRAIADGSLEVKPRRDRLVTYPNCLVASEFVDWLVSMGAVKKRPQAVALGQDLLDAKFLVHVRNTQTLFKDEYQLFHVTESAFRVDDEEADSDSDSEDYSDLFDDADVPSWFRQIPAPDPTALASSESEDEDETDGEMPPTSPGAPRWSRSASSRLPHGPVLADVSQLEATEADFDWQGFDEKVEDHMASATDSHLMKFLSQTLDREGLNSSWSEVVHHLVKQVDANVRPNVRRGDLPDVREYVKIKCLPGDEPCDSWFSSGAIFTKDVAHKKMKRTLRRPRILLLRFALEFQRAEHNKPRFSSLEMLMMQEEEFLKKSVQKIVLWRPDIVMVERTVSRVAQDMILKEGLALMLNVKPTVMNYVARLTQADVLESIEHLNFQPRLGRCEKFELRTFELPDGSKKTLALFDGCDPHRGCTIVLRGADVPELKRVKRAVRFLCYVKYSLALEAHFIRNEFAMLQACMPSPSVFGDEAAPDALPRSDSDSIRSRISSSCQPLTSQVSTDADARSRRRRIAVTSASEEVDQWIDAPHAQAFRNVLDSVLLSTSPMVVLPVPYVYSVASLASPARQLVPEVCFWSPKLLSLPGTPAGRDCMPAGAKDCFDPAEHQNIKVLFSCWTEGNKACLLPRQLTLEFYGSMDVTLGQFIEEYCFRPGYTCPSGQCEKSIESHLRSFVHDRGRVNIGMERLRDPIDPGATGSEISMWSWCKVCQQVTPPVLMNEQTWNMSFAKCLELFCMAPGYIDRGLLCPHSVHHNHVTYFGQGTLTVYFDYDPIDLLEIVIPSTRLQPSRPASLITSCRRQVDNMDTSCTRLWEDVGERLFGFDVEAVETVRAEAAQTTVTELKEQLMEQQQYATAVREKCLQEMAAWAESGDTTLETRTEDGTQLVDYQTAERIDMLLYELKMRIRDWVVSWNQSFQEVLPSFTPKKNTKRSQTVSGERQSAGGSSPRLGRASLAVSSRSGSRAASPALSSSEANTGPPTPIAESPPKLAGLPSPTARAAANVPRPQEGARRRSASGAPLTSDSPEKTDRPESEQSWTEVDNVAPAQVLEANKERRKEGQGYMKKLTATLLATPNNHIREIRMPFPIEYHILAPGKRAGLVVYEDEPSSIIAYTLASNEYHNFLTSQSDGSPASVRSNASGPPEQAKGPDMDLPDHSRLFKYAFGDRVAHFYCKVPFAREFRQLRHELLSSEGIDDPDDDFIRSLSRCVKWEAHGGKSGAAFCKMTDDRYILKQMSRSEAHSIMEFCPQYVKYMLQACKEKRPTVVAKIVGVYLIGFTNTQTGREMKQSVLIMENLFYNRRIGRIFDLKGSMRSRYVKTTGRDDDVLLDENLLEFICESPLFVRAHSKVVLEKAIHNDTNFLTQHGVMDYSLLVGIDEDSKQLVVGIIDYIRTFTWDKKLEMWIKSSGILGGRGNLPTVVSPEAYKERFKEAMSLYFLTVPDRWMHVGLFSSEATEEPAAPQEHLNIA